MTPKEAQTAFHIFSHEVGSRAEVYVSIDVSGGGAPLRATCYPNGIVVRDALFSVAGDTFDGLLEECRVQWAALSDEQDKRAVRKMALAIINITAEQGQCSDSALRAADFSNEDIARYGLKAVMDADDIASNGPFAIVAGASANAA